MNWRYQPVYTVYDKEGYSERSYSLIEVYLKGKRGKLEAWTEKSEMTPYGETQAGLVRDLANMLREATRWKAVAFDDLKVGMTFEREE
jgi:hypothetical protein